LPLVVAALAGLVHAASIAPRPWPALQLLALMGLVMTLRGLPVRRAALAGWLFGATWLGVSVWWLFISMHRYGELPAWLAAAAVVALALFLGSFTAAACGVWARWSGRGGLARDAVLFAALWLLTELLRAQWLTGFPWAASGYAHVDGLLAVLAPWLGVYGIGAAGAVTAAALGLWLKRALAMRRGAGAAALITLAVAALLQWWAPRGPDFTTPAGRLTVTLLQGNVAQNEKFDPSLLPASLAWHDQALRAATTDLVLAPETAVPLLPQDLPFGYWDGLRSHFEHGKVAALFGVPLGEPRGGYTNSAVGMAAGLPTYRYDKHHLVPFGEFIPLGFRWFVDLMNMPLGDFNRGALVAPSFVVHGLRVAPNICYEDLFGEELAARFVDPLQAPHLMANLSNIGWFGESFAVQQHLQISRLRTLELQRPMLRATNTGATVVIDHRGVVTHALAPHRVGVLVGEVDGRLGVTPYAAWAGRLGLWPLWILAMLLVLLALKSPRRRGPAGA
jgi:apolipoprotein N-acyltransferase